LQAHHFSAKTNFTHIKSTYAFNGNVFAFFKILQRIVPEKFFAASLVKAYLNYFTGTFRIAEWQVH